MDNRKKVLDYIDSHTEELYGILSQLVQCDTQNFGSAGREANGQECLWKLCRAAGLEPDLYCPDDVPGLREHPGYLSGRGTDKRPNLSVVFPAESARRRVTLAAHMDTVPIGDESAWTVPPLGGLVRDGRIWGRGAGDDKAGVAVGFFVLTALRALGVRLRDEIVLTSYVDEEFGGGNGSLAACLRYPSDVYVNLDGSDLVIGSWGVGGCVYNIDVCAERPVEDARFAYEGLKILTEELDAFGARRAAELQAHPVYRGSHEAENALRYMELTVGRNGNDLGRGHINFVFYTLSGEKEIRAELEEVRARASGRLAALGLRLGELVPGSRFFLPYVPEKESDDAERIGRYTEAVTGSKAVHRGFCLSDLAIFGPFGGGQAFNFGIDRPFSSAGGAHQPDEYVECGKLVAEAKILAQYLLNREKEVF